MVMLSKFEPTHLIELAHAHLERNLDTISIVEPKLRNNITIGEVSDGAESQFNVVILDAVMTVMSGSDGSIFWLAQEAYGWEGFEDAALEVKVLGFSRLPITASEQLVADIIQFGGKRIAEICETAGWEDSCFAFNSKK